MLDQLRLNWWSYAAWILVRIVGWKGYGFKLGLVYGILGQVWCDPTGLIRFSQVDSGQVQTHVGCCLSPTSEP